METRRVKREVIENKLLAVLDDENTVAIALSEEDLELLISAVDYQLTQTARDYKERGQKQRLRFLLEGMRQLRTQAFDN